MVDQSREAFERVYGERTDTPLEAVQGARMKDGSYAIPKMATAWRWWQVARAEIVVPLAPVYGVTERAYRDRCVQFIKLVGVGVAV